MLSNSFSTTLSDLVSTDIDIETGVAVITMNYMPVNSLSLEMFQALSASIKSIEQDERLQALVLQSGNPSIFSAGLDLREMADPDPDRLNAFWTSFQQLYLDLYGSRLASIAAIEGHAPAAGCMLALSCDYRIMSETEDKHAPTIGLNETQFGIVAPPFLAQQLIDTIGRRPAELSLSLGTLYSPDDAMDIGLVDEVVSRDVVRQRAQETASQWARIPSVARVASKMLIRQDAIASLKQNREKDLEQFVSFCLDERTQKNLQAYLVKLTSRKKK